jgi:hypothetical protein
MPTWRVCVCNIFFSLTLFISHRAQNVLLVMKKQFFVLYAFVFPIRTTLIAYLIHLHFITLMFVGDVVGCTVGQVGEGWH